MAYNISRNYEDPEIRWKYIHDAVKLLRDEGIKYNPQEPLVYDQLAYLFEHKIGHNMDDHHRYYKFRWMVEKYDFDGPLKDCWLTTAVSQPVSLGSSI